MNLKSSLTNLAKSLDWHPSRCLTFSSIVMGLIDQHNVQHHALSRFLNDNPASLKSRLERIRSFFQKQLINYQAFASNMVENVFGTIPCMDIIIDRTNWQLGKQNINYLVLAARIGKITFPLFWSLLEHAGCSDASARIELLEKFNKTFGFKKIRSFIADREFIGQDWLDYLYYHQIPFFIRIKDNRLIELVQGKKSLLRCSFHN